MDKLIPEARVGLGIEYLFEPIDYDFVSIRVNFAGILEGAELVEADPAIVVRSGSAGSFDAGQGVNLSLDRPL